MSRILFYTWSGGGNLPPEIGLAQELQRRGHAITFAGYDTQRVHIDALGFTFILLERANATFRSLKGLPALLDGVFVSTDHLSDVPETLFRVQADVLVMDCMLFAAVEVAAHLEVPTTIFVHTAPGALGVPGGTVERLTLESLNALRATDGKAPIARLWEAWSGFPTLCATLPALDSLAAQMPRSFDYVGPIFERATGSDWRSPWPENDPRPLALVSFSTTSNWDQTSRIQRTLAALGNGPYRVLVTTGQSDVSAIIAPTNAVLVPSAPHAAVMPHAGICVTHAGHGTIIAALANGVPLLCLPNPNADQPSLAAKVHELGAGIALDGNTATPEDIAVAAQRILSDPSYAATARRIAVDLARMPGAIIAANHVETLLQRGI